MNLGERGQIVLQLLGKTYVIGMYEVYYYAIMSMVYILLLMSIIRVIMDRYLYTEIDGKEVYIGVKYGVNHPAILTPVCIYVLYKHIDSVAKVIGILKGG